MASGHEFSTPPVAAYNNCDTGNDNDNKLNCTTKEGVTLVPPCSHNSWDNVRAKRDCLTLRCRVCCRRWKTSSARLPRCQLFRNSGSCKREDCPEVHVHRFKHATLEAKKKKKKKKQSEKRAKNPHSNHRPAEPSCGMVPDLHANMHMSEESCSSDSEVDVVPQHTPFTVLPAPAVSPLPSPVLLAPNPAFQQLAQQQLAALLLQQQLQQIQLRAELQKQMLQQVQPVRLLTGLHAALGTQPVASAMAAQAVVGTFPVLVPSAAQ